MKNKKVMFYGTGIFFQLINQYFNLSEINVLGVVDKKYKNVNENKEYLGYKTFKPEQIIDMNPDYVIITTKMFVPIAGDLYFDYLEKTNIKLIPILKRNIFELLKEIAEIS